jgi:hypothetical protein
MNDILLFVALVAVWIALRTWVLPRMGVPS